MPAHPAHIIETLQGLNSTFRFAIVGPQLVKEGTNERIVVEGYTSCQIIDLTTNEVYFVGTGPDEATALETAVKGAITADKPLTAAQKYKQAVEGELSDKDKEIAALKAKLARKEAKASNAGRTSEPDTTT